MIGRQLGQFEILAEVGAGAMGVVYRARDHKLGRLVAIKVLPQLLRQDSERRLRLLSEARAASALNHPGIVTVYQVDEDGGVDYIAMELVEGRALVEVIAAGPIELARALRYACRIVEAIAAAHAAGIVHRDLKPANVMITSEDSVKVLDFGLAKQHSIEGALAAEAGSGEVEALRTAPGMLLGTPAYMAPEQALGQAASPRSDVFALGCILYELVTGRRPFDGDSAVAVLSAVLKDTPAPAAAGRTDVPPALERVLEHALAKNPAERYPSARELLADLERIATVTSTSPTLVMPAPRRRRRRWAVAVVALGALAVATAAWWLTQTRDRLPAPVNFRTLFDAAGVRGQACFSPDGGMIAFITEDAAGVAQIFVKNLDVGDPIQVTHGAEAASHPAWSPRNDQILFERGAREIWSVAPLGGAVRLVVQRGRRPAFSPAGDRFVFEAEDRLWTAAIDGGEPRELEGAALTYFNTMAPAAPAWSPDGRSIVFFRAHLRRPLGDLWVMPAAGGEARRLTSIEATVLDPTWSPNGRWVIFSSDHTGSRTLWAVPAGGGPLTAVTAGAGEDIEPTFASNGSTLVYTNTQNLYTVDRLDPATGERRTLYESRRPIIVPTLSPDGEQLAFFGRTTEGIHLLVLSLADGILRQVTRRQGEMNVHPRWTSDGRHLLYYQEEPTLSLRRIAVDGGLSTEVLPNMNWSEQTRVELSPGDRFLSYSLRRGGEIAEARVRDLETGVEWTLAEPLFGCRWSADGTTLLGEDKTGSVQLCPYRGEACRRVTTGQRARFSPDGRWIYFLRNRFEEVWRSRPDGSEEEAVGSLGGYQSLYFDWDILPDGALVWVRTRPGRPELWRADLH